MSNSEPFEQEVERVNTEVVRKKKVRAGHRCHLKKMCTTVDNILKEYNPSLESELLSIRECLVRKAAVISKLDEELLDSIEDENEIAKEINAAEEFQNFVRKKGIEIEQFLSRIKDEENRNRMPALEQPIPIIRERDKVRVKLPKLQIEKFSGDPKQYCAFRDVFDLVTNENNDLTDVEKFTYLRSYLTGDALRLQVGLALIISNYRVALELLERRFGTKQVIINSHMESLYKLPVIRSSEDVRSTRDFHDKIEMNLQSVEAIGVEPESYGCLLVPMIKDKIPNELNIHTSCKFDASVDIWKINDLMRELKLEIEARESVGDAKRLKSQRTPKDTVEGLLSVDKITCPFCQQDHFADRCNIVTNVNIKKKNSAMLV